MGSRSYGGMGDHGGGKVEVRWAGADDAVDLLRVHQASVRGLARSHYTVEQIEAWVGHNTRANYVRALEAGENIWMAMRDGMAAGFSARLGDEIRAVYVHPDAAGFGVGKILLATAEGSARAEGIVRLHLDASLNAVPFYARMGYAGRSVRPHTLRDGTVIPSVPMTKDL